MAVAELLAGMVPASIDTNAGTGTFVRATHASFTEPFYDQTITRLKKDVPARTTATAALDDLAELPPARPQGFVFHTARCGSTLLARMLRHDRSTIVFSEPSPLAFAQRLDEASDHLGPSGAAMGVVGTLGQFADARQQRMVLKFTSWQAKAMGAFMGMFPSTPVVFVYRRPDAVVSSLMAEPPAWTKDGVEHSDSDSDSDSLAVRFASTWAHAVESALAAPQDRLLLLDHDDLVHSPVDVLTRVATHFGLSPGLARSAANEGRYYAKSLDPSERFAPAGRHARSALAENEQAEVEALTGPAWARLVERR